MISLDNVWLIFGTLVTAVGPVMAVLVGLLTVRLLVSLLFAFLSQMRTVIQEKITNLITHTERSL